MSVGSETVIVEKTVDERESLGSRDRLIRLRVGEARENSRRLSEWGVTVSLPRLSDVSLVDGFLF